MIQEKLEQKEKLEAEIGRLFLLNEELKEKQTVAIRQLREAMEKHKKLKSVGSPE